MVRPDPNIPTWIVCALCALAPVLIVLVLSGISEALMIRVPAIVIMRSVLDLG